MNTDVTQRRRTEDKTAGSSCPPQSGRRPLFVRAVTAAAIAGAVGAASGVGLAVSATADSSGGPVLTTNSPVVFNFVPIGASSSPSAAVLTNSGTGSLKITSVQVAGNNPGDFHVTADACTGASLGASQSCSVSVVFKPSATGTRVADLVIGDSRGSCVNYVTLAGSAAATGAAPAAHTADCVVQTSSSVTSVSTTVTSSTTTVVTTSTQTASSGVDASHVITAAKCESKRRIVLHLAPPAGDRIIRAKVYVDGALAASFTGRRITTAAVDLRGKALGRYRVRVIASTAGGKTLRTPTRFFVTCVHG